MRNNYRPKGFKVCNESTQDNTLLELVLITLICFCLGFALFYNPKSESSDQTEPSIEEFYRYFHKKPMQKYRCTWW